MELTTMLDLSIIITNYNYGQFLAEAIDSAIAIPGAEVIVVDDGSTDGVSQSVIAQYNDQIVKIAQANSGQSAATMAGLAASTGRRVAFLDADDVLLPDFAKLLSLSLADPMTVRVQGSMQAIGKMNQIWRLAPDTDPMISLRAVGDYPGSANGASVWARWFLEKVFPIPERLPFFDDYLHLLAPFFGRVVTISDVVTHYRFHGGNSNWLYGRRDILDRTIKRAENETAMVRAVSTFLVMNGKPLSAYGVDLDRNLDRMSNRLVKSKFSAYEPNVLKKFLTSVLAARPGMNRTILLLAWGLLVRFSPRTIALRFAMTRLRW
jgi:glycosyltransferase involved in cell wall biosynthesis